jgi:ArsR family transcriptional regulator
MPETDIVNRLIEDREIFEVRAQVLKALGHPARLRITAFLCVAGEKTVSEIHEALDLPQSTVSQQLASLRLNGLVTARKAGGFRHYSIAIPQLRDLMVCLSKCRRSGAEAR